MIVYLGFVTSCWVLDHKRSHLARTSLLQVKRTRRGSATSSMKTTMCTQTKSLRPSLAHIMVLLGPIYHGRIFTSETDRSDLDGVVVNHTEREFQVTTKMKARRTAGKQPVLVHMPTGSSLDYHHVVH